MIPFFPEFKNLELTDKEEIERIISKYHGYSDFNFVSLWSYNTEDDITISILNSNLVVKFRDYITNEQFYSFIGTNKIAETIDILLLQSEKEGITPQLKLIPEENILLENQLDQKFNIHEDKSNQDYILSVREHSSLEGSRYYKHRKLINKFYRDNPSFKIRELDLGDQNTVKEIFDLFYFWENKKNKTRDETIHELTALTRTIKDFRYLNLIGLGVYVDRKLIGMTVADRNNSNYIETHFSKYHPDYNGMNHLLHHLLAKHVNKSHQYLNLEQDLGIEGLRSAKESAKPVKYLRKYIISRRLTD